MPPWRRVFSPSVAPLPNLYALAFFTARGALVFRAVRRLTDATRFFRAEEARAFFARATPAAAVAAAPTTAATTPAVRECVIVRSAFAARPVTEVERDVDEVFDFMGT